MWIVATSNVCHKRRCTRTYRKSGKPWFNWWHLATAFTNTSHCFTFSFKKYVGFCIFYYSSMCAITITVLISFINTKTACLSWSDNSYQISTVQKCYLQETIFRNKNFAKIIRCCRKSRKNNKFWRVRSSHARFSSFIEV